VYLLNEFSGSTSIIFVATCAFAQKVTVMMGNLGLKAVCLHGQMQQGKRLAALARFKAGERSILVATDVAARGLDIADVDLVVNYDVPGSGKDYIHRVGRTARAGRAGRAVTLVTQYDVEIYKRIEVLLERQLEEFPKDEEAAMLLVPRVAEASRLAALEAREGEAQRGGGKRKWGGGEGDDPEQAAAEAVLQESSQRRRTLGAHVRGRGGGRGGGGRGRGGGGRGRGRG
jgi:ATP-dependent RNA helicase DDX47/RRP3